MEPCPECGCAHIGDDVLYATGWAKFCQGCGHKGPRVTLWDAFDDTCRAMTEADAAVEWNQMAHAKKRQDNTDDLRFSA